MKKVLSRVCVVGFATLMTTACAFDHQTSVLVPTSAIRQTQTDTRPFVYAIAGDAAQRRNLTLGIVDEVSGMAQVTDGLVEGDRVILDQPAAEAKQRFEHLGRDRGFFRDEERETGPHMLDRAFSGTYER